jgi:hypothetical protein
MDHFYEPRSTTIALIVEVITQRSLHSLSVEAMDAVINKDAASSQPGLLKPTATMFSSS